MDPDQNVKKLSDKDSQKDDNKINLKDVKSPQKFSNMFKTLDGEDRAFVNLKSLDTLWINTGTKCNLECKNCYIESSPKNDRLSFITAQDITPYLNEIVKNSLSTKMIGLTGGEPFLNPEIIDIIKLILKRDFDLLILTNAHRMIKRYEEDLLKIQNRYGNKLHLRISLDHFTEKIHDKERGKGTFQRTLKQTKWLYDNNFNISIASRSLTYETPESSLQGHKNLLDSMDINLDLKEKLVIFPEMKSGRDLPEITTACWNILKKNPDDQMCASERMIVKRKNDPTTKVMPCTLLAYDDQFILGESLTQSKEKVFLNHKFCAEFCVLGGASCSRTI